MSNSKDRDLFLLVQSYFKDHLTKVQGASRHTIIAYRDAARLFLQFLADTRGCSVSELCLDDIVVQRVLEFLDYLESRRNNTISTRNCRLAAVRSLAGHLLRQDPTRAAQYHRILSLRSKKTGRTAVSYLEPVNIR
ncbi:MAG: site-specific integrase [Planctomycetota bacterium]|nr:site-specific integrase [Planctomycetota bacterium]